MGLQIERGTMKYNIILEGCDCTGKTTLQKALLDRLKGSKEAHMKAPKSKEGALHEYKNWVEVLNLETGWILDRGFLGECVYAPLMRNYYPEYMRDLERELYYHNVLILVVADPTVVQERFDGKFIKKKDIPHVLHRFWCEWAASNYIAKMVVDTTNQSADELAEAIIAECKRKFK